MKKTEIKSIILFVILFPAFFLLLLLFPSISSGEGKTVHRGIYVEAIQEIFEHYPEFRERIITYLHDHTPSLAERETECGYYGVTHHPTTGLLPELDGTLGVCSEILPDPSVGCEGNNDPLCPTCIDLCDPDDTDPEMDDVYNEIEIIGNESLITDFYKDVTTFQWFENYENGKEIAGEYHNFTAFNHFIGLYDDLSYHFPPGSFIPGYRCYYISLMGMENAWMHEGGKFSYWDGYYGRVQANLGEWIEGDMPLDVFVCKLAEEADYRIVGFPPYVSSEVLNDDYNIVLTARGEFPPYHDATNDLGYEEDDMGFLPVSLLGSYWMEQYVRDGYIRYLGPAAHALTDARVPQHAYGVLANFHSAWEGTTGNMWRDEREGFGKSPFCLQRNDAGEHIFPRRSDCFVALARDYAMDLADLTPPDVGRIAKYKGLLDLAASQAIAVHHDLVDDLDVIVGQHMEDTCNTLFGFGDCGYREGRDIKYDWRAFCRYEGYYTMGGIYYYYHFDCNLDEDSLSEGCPLSGCPWPTDLYECQCAFPFDDRRFYPGDDVSCPMDYACEPEDPDCPPPLAYCSFTETLYRGGAALDTYGDNTTGLIGPVIVGDEIVMKNYDLLQTARTQIDSHIGLALLFLSIVVDENIEDNDGIPAALDNCPDVTNPNQSDRDQDGFGDACDGCPSDPTLWSDPESTDRDGDGLSDQCDLCPDDNPMTSDFPGDPEYPDNRIDDPARSSATQDNEEETGDGLGARCDNCPDHVNPNQANCNALYEDAKGLPRLGDMCDSDPCVSLCLETDRFASEGGCSTDDSPYLLGMQSTMLETRTMSNGTSDLVHFDHGFVDYLTGREERHEAQQVYWCSCRNIETGQWYESESDCIDQCPEDGSRPFTPATRIGWFETLRKDTMLDVSVPCPCAHDPSRICACPMDCVDNPESACSCDMFDGCTELPPCSPWQGRYDQEPETCLFHGSHPKRAHPYTPPPRKDHLVDDELLLYHYSLRYPDGTPETIYLPGHGYQSYNRMKFWLRPLDNEFLVVYDENNYNHPIPSRGPLFDNDWNNRYTHFQHILDFDIPIGYVHLGELSDGHTLRMLQAWGDGGPPEAKDKVIIPDLFYFDNGHCPPWLLHLCSFDAPPPESAIQGIAFLEFDPRSRTFTGILASKSVQGQVPTGKGLAMTSMTALNDEGQWETRILAFGGRNNLGELSNATWEARRGLMSDGQEAFYWSLLDTAASAPIGTAPQDNDEWSYFPIAPTPRIGAALLTRPESYEVLMFGGEDETGLLGDMWSLMPIYQQDVQPEVLHTTWHWSRVMMRGEIPSPRKDVSVAVDGREAILYGGITRRGPSSEVFRLDMSGNGARFTKILAANTGPGPRLGATLEYEANAKVVYLYGGMDETGVIHNDLWELNISMNEWYNLREDCTFGECPLPADDSVLVRDTVTGRLTLIPGTVGVSSQIYYVPDNKRWISQSEIEGTDRNQDCDGDGTMEAAYGMLCSTGTPWWSPPGSFVCDSFTSALTCSSAGADGEEIASLAAPSGSSFAVERTVLWLAREGTLIGYDISSLDHIRTISTLNLPGRTRDILLSGGYIFAATDKRVMVIDVNDASSPFVATEIATCGQARSLALWDSVLAVASSGGIGLIDVAYPPDSLGLGMLWVSEHGRTVFTEMTSMEECMFLSDAEQEVLDDIISGPFGASLEVVDGKFLAAGRDKVMLFGIHKGREPMLIGFADLKGRIEEIRVAHNYVYVNMKGNKTFTVDVTDPANMTIVGSHEVAYWVQGLEVSDSRAFLLDGNRLRIALIQENGGWQW